MGPDFRGHTQCPRGRVRDRHCPRWGPGLEVQRWETTMSSLWSLHGGHLSLERGPWGHPTGASLILSPGSRLVLLLLPLLETPGEHVGLERQPWPGVGFPGRPPRLRGLLCPHPPVSHACWMALWERVHTHSQDTAHRMHKHTRVYTQLWRVSASGGKATGVGGAGHRQGIPGESDTGGACLLGPREPQSQGGEARG